MIRMNIKLRITNPSSKFLLSFCRCSSGSRGDPASFLCMLMRGNNHRFPPHAPQSVLGLISPTTAPNPAPL
jgi:hypothetical protein